MPVHRLDPTVIRLGVGFLPALAMLALGSGPAGALPEDVHPSLSTPVAGEPAPPPAEGRPCFMVRAPWNDALDGPQPRC